MLDEEDSPFKRYRGPEISYRTMGFIGFGAIGARVKHLLNGFDMNFLVYDPYLPAEIAEKEGVKLCSLDEVLAGSDFVSVHCAVTPQTTGMIGAEEFKKMKPTAYFINTARGKIASSRVSASTRASTRFTVFMVLFFLSLFAFSFLSSYKRGASAAPALRPRAEAIVRRRLCPAARIRRR